MILIGLLALIISAVLSHIVLFKGTKFLDLIGNKYRDGIPTELSSPEELKNKIVETCSDLIKGTIVNSSGQVEVTGNTGTHLFYLENGRVKCELVKYDIRLSRVGRLLAWMKIVPKMKMANEFDAIFKNISGSADTDSDNEKIINSVSGKTKLTNIFAILSIILIVCSVSSLPENNTESDSYDVYVETIQATKLNDSEHTHKEIFNDFFSNPTWKHFTGEDGKETVEFTGECLYQENDVKVKVQYLITNETESTLEWQLNYFDINGEPQDLNTFDGMIAAAISNYQK
ncbi:MAG: hypothetical protein E7416_01005 [Ruminococcaceae bacterium]|nr:hypothetical protein [Oscillospiraceae bacterium]